LKPHESAPAKAELRKGIGTAEEAIRACYGDLGAPTASWSYFDADGNKVGRTLRWDQDEGDKEIRPIAWIDGQWSPNAMKSPRPLYRLLEVLDAKVLFVCEGEKVADVVCECGLVATTSAGGSSGAGQSDWSPCRGKRVVILQDNDGPGANYAAAVERLAKKAGAIEVIILDFTDRFSEFPEKGDAEQALELLDGDHQQLAALLDDMLKDGREDAAHARPKPRDSFPVDLLPKPVQDLVRAVAQSRCVDVSVPGAFALAAMGSAIGRSRETADEYSDWYELPAIWVAVNAPSGARKSPVLSDIFAPHFEKQGRALKKYAKEKASFERVSGGDSPPPASECPVLEHILTTNGTPQGLSKMLSTSPRGVISIHDELTTLLGGFGRQSGAKDADRAFYLSLFSGTFEKKDLACSDCLSTTKAIVSIVGAIQPAMLQKVFDSEAFGSGLAPRFLLVSPRIQVKLRRRGPDQDQKAAYADFIECLFDLDMEEVLDEVGNSKLVSVGLPFSKAACSRLNSFIPEWSAEAMAASSNVAALMSKLEAYALRFALILAVCREVDFEAAKGAQEITLDDLNGGIRLVRWFLAEATLTYDALSGKPEPGPGPGSILLARAQVIRIRFDGAVSTREWQRATNKKTAPDANAELDELASAGLAEWVHQPISTAGGPPSKRCVLKDLPDGDHDATPLGDDHREGCVIRDADSSAQSPRESPTHSAYPPVPASTATTGDPPDLDNGCVLSVPGSSSPAGGGIGARDSLVSSALNKGARPDETHFPAGAFADDDHSSEAEEYRQRARTAAGYGVSTPRCEPGAAELWGAGHEA
jgi:hypothetical protein